MGYIHSICGGERGATCTTSNGKSTIGKLMSLQLSYIFTQAFLYNNMEK